MNKPGTQHVNRRRERGGMAGAAGLGSAAFLTNPRLVIYIYIPHSSAEECPRLNIWLQYVASTDAQDIINSTQRAGAVAT